ncbi:MAG: hypothetical protein HY318_00835 [Armatimonadetes bacterium]|nr:hypothetical protein [Armatimonadota bacterium]
MKSVYQFVLPKMVMLSVTLLLYSIALFAVFMVCLLPGMFTLGFGNKVVGGVLLVVGVLLGLILFFLLAVWFLFVSQACVLENHGYFSAFNRSQQLVSGYFWKVAGTMILAFLIVIFLQVATMMPVGILAGIGMYSSANTSQMPPVWNSVMALSNIIYNTLLYPFLGIVMTLLYYDLRIRKEGFDLEMMAQEAGYGSLPGTSIGDGSTTPGAAGGE